MYSARDLERYQKLNEFIATVNIKALCQKYHFLYRVQRFKLREFAIIVELKVREAPDWHLIVRSPFDTTDSAGEESTLAYAAALQFLTEKTKIPVPKVYYVCPKSKPGNVVNATYMIMECIAGWRLHPLRMSLFEDWSASLYKYRRVYSQLVAMTCELGEPTAYPKIISEIEDFFALASFKFDKIGSLRQDPDGKFYVGPYVHPRWTANSSELSTIYEDMSEEFHGPYDSTTDYYRALSKFSRRYGLAGSESALKGQRDIFLGHHVLIDEMIPKWIEKAYDNGPFFLNHDELTLENILIDENFNIKAIIEFPGTVVPLPSLCSYPRFFTDESTGFCHDREAYFELFLRLPVCHDSALHQRHLREQLMEISMRRQLFEDGLKGFNQHEALRQLFPDHHKRPFYCGKELTRIAQSDAWFSAYARSRKGDDGLYSWQRRGDKNAVDTDDDLGCAKEVVTEGVEIEMEI